MTKKRNASVIGVSAIIPAVLMAINPMHAAIEGGGQKKQALKAGGQRSGKTPTLQSPGSASISSAAVVSESGTASNLVRSGLSVSLINEIQIADLRQFSKMVESQRASDGLASVTASFRQCNASGPGGVLFITNVAKLIAAGQNLDRLADFSRAIGKGEISAGDSGNFLAVVVAMGAEKAKGLLDIVGNQISVGNADARKLVKTIASAAGTDVRDLVERLEKVSLVSDLESAGQTAAERAAAERAAAERAAAERAAAERAAAERAAAERAAAERAAAEQAFRVGLSADARAVYDALTTEQQAEFKKLFTDPLYTISLQNVSALLGNAVLMEKFISLMDSALGKSFSNPLLQEAAVVGNQILRDVVKSNSFSISSANAFTYDKLLPNGYNKALAVLIAKYSNNEAIANTVNAFVDSKRPISGATLLNEIFTESGENTDLLGLRKLSYIKPTSNNLNYAISQGEAWIARNFSIGSESGLTIDITGTNLSQADTSGADRLGVGGGPEGARLFAITALGNMSLSGAITIENRSLRERVSNEGFRSVVDASMTRNVVSFGALNTLEIADHTRIFNQGRALVLGAGKLQGPNGGPISGLSLRSEGSIALGSGKSLFLENASFTTGQSNPKLLMYAENTISLNNPLFNGFGYLSNFYFEAITINLSNVSLPGGVFIRLVSRDGGTADGSLGYGYFPRFGAPAVGRVNFMGVSIGGYAINNISDFDAFGGNIRIGKIGAASGPLGYFLEDSRAAFNTVLMENFPALIAEAPAMSFTNPMLQEAGTVGNQILRDVSFDQSFSFTSGQAFTYDKLFPNGYNKALVALIAKYSGNERLVAGVDALIAVKSPINNSTSLSNLFFEKNTDLLGLRKQSYFNLDPRNPVTSLSQGESYLARAIAVVSDSGVTLDVTDTKLKEAGNTKATSRLYTVGALGDMSMSGKITVKNTNPNADKTRNAVAIGAVNSLRVADRTEIINQGRVLAVGAGKLRGTSGETITGLKLESKGAIAVGSGKNIHLVDATFKVGSDSKSHLVMFAQSTIDLTNPTFQNFGSKSRIYMEATTVNLTSVDFPDGAKVRLRSRDGGTQNGTSGEGAYPKFGTSAPGRVNFISNVKYNGNLLGDTTQFDMHGGNIKIEKASQAN
jgi:hypothetical protein